MKGLLSMLKERAGIAAGFLWEQRFWWLIPLALVLLFIAVLVFLSQTPDVDPFVYTLF